MADREPWFVKYEQPGKSGEVAEQEARGGGVPRRVIDEAVALALRAAREFKEAIS